MHVFLQYRALRCAVQAAATPLCRVACLPNPLSANLPFTPTWPLPCPQAGGRMYVLRKKPPGKVLPSAHAVDREYRVLDALQATPVPVPRTVRLPFFGLALAIQALGWEWCNGVGQCCGRIALRPPVRCTCCSPTLCYG